MWPFKKRKRGIKPETFLMDPGEISYSQLDITEAFGDNEQLDWDDWIPTIPLNTITKDWAASGLPATSASDEEVYAIAEELSEIRESILIPEDGVYCPICHIANIQLEKLRTPCPGCNRPLLKFGWD